MQCLRTIKTRLLVPTGMIVLLMLSTAFAYSNTPALNSNIAAKATVYLDFDGHTVQGTSWNWDGTIYAQPSNLNSAAITEIFNRVAEDYRIFNINITTDLNVYNRAPAAKRIRVIITPTSQWYGIAGGAAFVHSFTWGDGTPAFVFTDQLYNHPKYIGEAVSHETGHTLGLQHQSTFDKSCGMVTEYAEGKGDGEISWAPIMGVGYYRNLTTWNIGTSVEGCSVIQNDIDIISNSVNEIGLRSDDHGNTVQSATTLEVYNHNFESSGMINTGSDKDLFKIELTSHSLLKASAIPNNVGTGNQGANIDIQISLLKSTGDTIGRYNPADRLSASIDTNLSAGTYYLVIDGAANQNITKNNSIGYYSLSGGVDAVLPVTQLVLRGEVRSELHYLAWNFEADEIIKHTDVEISNDGIHFKNIYTLAASAVNCNYTPFTGGQVYYRVKLTALRDDKPYYSNIVTLRCTAKEKVSLISNMVTTFFQLGAGGDYAYQLLDETGKLLQRGKINAGMNAVAFTTFKTGILLLKVFNRNEQHVFKLIKR